MHCTADDVITPEDVFDVMEEDVQKADLILWVGISFEQSASTAYFRRVSCAKWQQLDVAHACLEHMTTGCHMHAQHSLAANLLLCADKLVRLHLFK